MLNLKKIMILNYDIKLFIKFFIKFIYVILI